MYVLARDNPQTLAVIVAIFLGYVARLDGRRFERWCGATLAAALLATWLLPAGWKSFGAVLCGGGAFLAMLGLNLREHLPCQRRARPPRPVADMGGFRRGWFRPPWRQ